LAHFDGLPGPAQASLSEITAVKGIGAAKAAEIKAALEIGRRILVSAPDERPQVRSPGDAANLVLVEMGMLEQECLRVILLDTRYRVLNIATAYVGSLNSSMIRVGELFREAIRRNAAGIIIAHNHPSGDPSP
jgi:DNA repair protein RadC